MYVKLSAVRGGGAGGVDDGEPTSFLGHHHDGDGTSGTSSPDSCRGEADTEDTTHHVHHSDQQMPPAAAAAAETSHDVVLMPQDLINGTWLC